MWRWWPELWMSWETREESFRDMCLQRDGFCCVVTGDMDTDHWEKLGYPDDTSHGPVEEAHIIPFAYASWNKSSGPPVDASKMWELLYRCFPNVDKVAKMKVENINDLSNGITLLSSIHEEFGKFTIAFRPTDRQNVYELQMFRRCPPYLRGSLPPDKIVEFKQAPGAEHLKLPSSDLLECHWRLAEILNASGMAEIIDGYRREWEDIKTGAGSSLREDGKTDVGKMLSVAFWQHVAG